MGHNSNKGGRNSSQNRPRRFGRGVTHATRVRHRLLTEWRGGVDPPSPVRNIHQPSEFLSEILKSVGLSEGIDEGRLKESWGAVAGEFVAKHTVPESIRGGVLVLRVLQPAMKFHLQQMSGKLLANMSRELGDGVVKQIKFKIG